MQVSKCAVGTAGSFHAVRRALLNSASAVFLIFAAVSAPALLAPEAAHAEDDGSDGFFAMLRAVAGSDNLITRDEFLAQVPSEANGGPPQAELDAFLVKATGLGATDANGNIKVENLINVIIANGTAENLAGIVGDGSEPLTLMGINAALPAGLAPDKVKDFLLSIERAPGGVVTKEAAEAAIYNFVGRDGNKGLGEHGKYVYDLFSSETSRPINQSVPSGAVSLENSANIFAMPWIGGPHGISVSSGQGGCQWDDVNFTTSCTPLGNGGQVTVVNSGTVVAFSEFDPNAPYLTAPGNAIDAQSIGGSVSVTNTGILGTVGADSSGIAAQTYNWDGTASTGNVDVTNSGLIQVQGDSTTGIVADAQKGSVTVVNSGAILGLGDDVRGIEAETGYSDREGVVAADNGINIRNSGLIEIAGKSASGITAHTGMGANIIENTGRIDLTGSNATAILATTSNGSVNVRSSGDVLAPGADSYGIIVVGVNAGGALDPTGTTNTSTAKLVVNIDDGTVQGGSGGRTFGFEPDTDSDSDDQLTVGSAGVFFLGGKDNLLSNKGTITALNGLAVSVFEGPLTFTDYDCNQNGCEKILSTVNIPAASLNAANLEGGKIIGDIVLGSAADRVTNSGEITGNVALGGGNNVLINNTLGRLKGDVTAGAGDDTLDNVGTFEGNTDVGDGNNAVRNSAGATRIGNVTAGAGDDDTRNAGTITGDLNLGAGNNYSGNGATGKITGNLTTGSGDDTLNNLGEWTGNAALGDGKNTVKNAAGAKLTGNVSGGLGNDSFSNAGTFYGNVEMGGGTNSLTNLTDGVFNSRDHINVGAGNSFTNSGILNPGGLGSVQATLVVGNFVQAVDGRLLIDINDSATGLSADRISVTGSATMAGLVVPNVVNIRDAQRNEYLIVSTTAGATSDGLDVAPKTITVRDTVAYDFEVDVRDNNDVYLTATQQAVEKIVEAASGAPGAGSQENLASLGKTLSAVEDQTGETTLKPVLQALRVESSTPEAAAKALNRLTPQQQSGQTNSTNTSGNAFSNAMLSCASRDQPYKFTKEDTCYYGKFTARKLDRDATTTSAGHEERGYEVMGGVQVNLGGDLRGGVALGYEDTSGDTFSTTQKLGRNDGDRFHGGLVLKNQWGPINAYLNVAGSYGRYDHTRFVNLGGFTNALGDQDVISGLVKLRLSYLNDMGSWYVKPLVDVGATYIDLDGYTEKGAGAFNLKVAAHSDWLFSVSPAIEIGGQIADGSGTLYRPFIRGGVTVFDKDDMTFSANFAGAPVGVTGFSVKSELDNVFGDVAAGVQVLTASGLNLKFEYEGRFGEHTTQNAGTVKMTLPY